MVLLLVSKPTFWKISKINAFSLRKVKIWLQFFETDITIITHPPIYGRTGAKLNVFPFKVEFYCH